MKAVYKHEMSMYLRSITAYVFAAILLCVIGIGSMLYNISASVANFEYAIGTVAIVFAVLVPILTMRVFSEERKQKTDQLLFSLPISTTDIVMGKYLALLTVFGVSMIPVFFYPVMFKAYGNVYLPTSYGTLFAFFCVGAALIAMGVFISSLTESQGLAAGICLVAVLFNYFSVTLADYASSGAFVSMLAVLALLLLLALVVWVVTKNGTIAYILAMASIIGTGVVFFINSSLFEGLPALIMQSVSLFERLDTFVNGVFDITAIVFFASYAALFLYLTVQSLEKRRYS